MNNFYTCKKYLIYCSFFVAILLQFILYCMTTWYLQPSWIMLLLIYWIMIFPNKISVGTGFILGLISDCIFNFILGTNAASLSILSYLTIRKIYFFRHIALWQQSFFILLFSLINQSIKFLIKFLVTKHLYAFEIFWNCVLDGLIWPFLILLMRKIYQFNKIN